MAKTEITKTISTRVDTEMATQVEQIAKSFERTPAYVYRQFIAYVVQQELMTEALKQSFFSGGNTMKVKNLLTADRELDALSYTDPEMYYPDHELNQFALTFSDVEKLDDALDSAYSQEEALKAKTFLRHMWGVRHHLENLFARVDVEEGCSPDAVIMDYLNDYRLDPEDEIVKLNDAVTLLKNRELIDLERMGLFSVVSR